MAGAPFFRVTFADFWLADQLNSLVPVFMDFQYFACFYACAISSNSWHEKKGKPTPASLIKAHLSAHLFAFLALDHYPSCPLIVLLLFSLSLFSIHNHLDAYRHAPALSLVRGV